MFIFRGGILSTSPRRGEAGGGTFSRSSGWAPWVPRPRLQVLTDRRWADGRVMRCIVGLVSLVSVLYTLPIQAALPPFLGDKDGTPTLAPLLRKVKPAVVNISVLSQEASQVPALSQNPLLKKLLESLGGSNLPTWISAGSGVIVDAVQGYVVTNHHVVSETESILVTLEDQRTFNAQRLGSDPGTDIALLKIEPDNLMALPFGDSEHIEVGDFVVAIGNPFGLGQTVTVGVISALGRSGLDLEDYEDFIQTDALISPGNSGGPLINLRGEIVGINTAIIDSGNTQVNIGFAIPSNMVRAVLDQLVKDGQVQRGRLGIILQDATPDLTRALDVSPETTGAIVTHVAPASPADQAKIVTGDVITHLNDKPIKNAADLRNRIGLARIGETLTLHVTRGKNKQTIKIQVAEGDNSVTLTGETLKRIGGALLQNIQISLPTFGHVQGVLVLQVDPDSVALRDGLLPGDIIVAVNRQPVQNMEELKRLVALEAATKPLALKLIRNDSSLFVVIK